MKIITNILIALLAVVGVVVALYGLFLGTVGILNAWLNRKGRRK
jgi:hypothetical protein